VDLNAPQSGVLGGRGRSNCHCPAPLTLTPRVGRALGSGVSLEIGAGIPEARGYEGDEEGVER